MYEADVFYMSIMQHICEQREQQKDQEQREDQYNKVRPWEA